MWREAKLPSLDSEQVVFRYIWFWILCSLYSTTTQWQETFWNGLWLFLTGYPEDVSLTRKLPSQSLEVRIPVRQMSQGESLQNAHTLKALRLPQHGGKVKAVPTDLQFRAFLSSRLGLSEVVKSEDNDNNNTAKIAPSIYPTLVHTKNWMKYFINLSFNLYPSVSWPLVPLSYNWENRGLGIKCMSSR